MPESEKRRVMTSLRPNDLQSRHLSCRATISRQWVSRFSRDVRSRNRTALRDRGPSSSINLFLTGFGQTGILLESNLPSRSIRPSLARWLGSWQMSTNTDPRRIRSRRSFSAFLPCHGRSRYLKYLKYLVVQTDVGPLTLTGAIRHEVAKVDPHQPLSEIQTTAGLLGSALERRRFNTLLIGIFATTALVILAAGIYGVMSFFVAQRTHEIGLRVAMGASWSRVQKLVFGQGIKLATIGVVVGLTGVFATTKLTGRMVYGVSPTDPVTLACGERCFSSGWGFWDPCCRRFGPAESIPFKR